MLAFFSVVDADTSRAQQQAGLQQGKAAAAEDAAKRARAPPPRGPGRPRAVTDSNVALAAAAHTATADTPAEAASIKRSKYHNWLATPHMHDILHAFQLNGRSARQTVQYLQRGNPRLPTETEARFAHLNEATVPSWHDKDGRVLERVRLQVGGGVQVAPRGGGYERVLAGYPAAEDRIKSILQQMRDRGAAVNILIIRFVMRSVLETDAAHLLDALTLSDAFISKWARQQLQWSWRVRTTSASKLPPDWRAKGVEMAKRIAYNIQIHKVHPSLVINMDQTGVHLAPAGTRTYEAKGNKVADVMLQRPFKHGLRKRFNEWAASTIKEQVETGMVEGLNLKMSSIKPLILQWCLESWSKVKEGRLHIQTGWDICCVSLFNVFDPVKRVQVLEEMARGELQASWTPGKETAAEDEGEQWEAEEDDKADELEHIMNRT